MQEIPDAERQKDNPDYVFSDINKVFEHLHKVGWSQISTLAYAGPCFQILQITEDWGAYFPMPMSPLYRGQRHYYDPCKPSIYRRQWTNESKLERLVQLEDFKHILDVNPEVKGLKSANLYVNYDGLAQHYGIETDMLDLTNSPLVAAFFATTEYDPLKDEYRPVEDCVSIGCIYFLSLGAHFNGFNNNTDGDIWPVGMEALRRPSEQRGYTMRLKEGQDFNTISGDIMCFRFIQNKDWSYRIFAATGGGKLLFPYDPMTEKVKAMRKYRIYGLDSLQKVYDSQSPTTLTFEQTKKALEDAGCHFLPTTPFSYNKDELEYINREYKRKFPNG